MRGRMRAPSSKSFITTLFSGFGQGMLRILIGEGMEVSGDFCCG
jgi:hypothetical protein